MSCAAATAVNLNAQSKGHNWKEETGHFSTLPQFILPYGPGWLQCVKYEAPTDTYRCVGTEIKQKEVIPRVRK